MIVVFLYVISIVEYDRWLTPKLFNMLKLYLWTERNLPGRITGHKGKSINMN